MNNEQRRQRAWGRITFRRRISKLAWHFVLTRAMPIDNSVTNVGRACIPAAPATALATDRASPSTNSS
jgi:hypothetical protein